MATVETATSRSIPKTVVIAGIIFLFAVLVGVLSWGAEAEFPVELPNVATPGEVAPLEIPLTASHADAASPVSSTVSTTPVAVPNATVSGNGDGRVMIQFEGLRPGVTAE